MSDVLVLIEDDKGWFKPPPTMLDTLDDGWLELVEAAEPDMIVTVTEMSDPELEEFRTESALAIDDERNDLYEGWFEEGKNGNFNPFFGCIEEVDDNAATVPEKLVHDYRSAAFVVGLLAIESALNSCLFYAIITPFY